MNSSPVYQHFANGPSVAVEFFIENSQIVQVNLQSIDYQGLVWSLRGASSSGRLEQDIHDWLQAYVCQEPISMNLPLKWRPLSLFTKQVLEQVAAIPFAHKLSYKEISSLLSRPKAYRAVGNACGRNPFPLIIPCHRVLASNQVLGGFTGGIEIKKRLLSFERIAWKVS